MTEKTLSINIKSFMRLFKSRQFAIFLLTGGISALANFSSRFVYSSFLSFPIAIVLAYLTGMLVSFILSKYYVFKNTTNSLFKSAISFFIVNMFGLIQALIVSMLLEYHLLPSLGIHQFDKAIATIIGISIPAFTSFIGYKYLSFKTVEL